MTSKYVYVAELSLPTAYDRFLVPMFLFDIPFCPLAFNSLPLPVLVSEMKWGPPPPPDI